MGHTKGEWKVSYNTTAHLPFAYVICDEQESCDEAQANAKLIASAPDMLNALIEITECKGAYNEDRLAHAENVIKNIIEIATSAINKATK